MNHYQQDLPERGKPRPEVKWSEHHSLVLRGIFYLHRIGAVATDESIFDAIVKAKGINAISVSGARTRRHELETIFHCCKQSQVKGRTRAGRTCTSYRLTDTGLDKARTEFEAAKQLRIDTERSVAA